MLKSRFGFVNSIDKSIKKLKYAVNKKIYTFKLSVGLNISKYVGRWE